MARDASPTMRVLHLIDPASAGWPSLHALSCLLRAARPGVSPSTLLVGSSADARLATEIGVRTPDRILTPAGRVRLAASPFRRYLIARGEPDVIHAWSRSALALAARVRPDLPAVATFAQPMPPPDDAERPLRSLFALSRARPPATPLRTLFLPGPLPIDPSLIDPASRARLRAAWGFEDATAVVGLLGEPAASSDVWGSGFVVGFLSVAGRRMGGVAHPDSANAERVVRYMRNLAHPWRLVFHDAPPWRVIPGLDAALWLGSADPIDEVLEVGQPRRLAPGAESVAWAVGAGLPVVIEDRPVARETLQQRDGAGLIPTRRPLDLSHALMRVLDDRALASEARRERAARLLALRRPEDWVARVEAAYVRVTSSREDAFTGATAAAADRSAAKSQFLEAIAARS